MPAAGRAARACLAALAVLCTAGVYDDEPRDYRRTDPDNPGGDRVGDDDGDDGFTGYPADPGAPGDAYRDASSEYRAYSPNWTGAFVGMGLVGGLATFRGPYLDGAAHAPVFGAFVNMASAQQALDLQLSYLRAEAHPSIDGSRSALLRQHAGADLLVHPFFLFIINTPPAAYTIANVYALLGFGVDRTRIGAPIDRSFDEVGWRFGTGIDQYLDNPNDGGAFWLGLQFQHGFVRGSPNVPGVGRQTLGENLVMLRLSYRYNGNLLRGGFHPESP